MASGSVLEEEQKDHEDEEDDGEMSSSSDPALCDEVNECEADRGDSSPPREFARLPSEGSVIASHDLDAQVAGSKDIESEDKDDNNPGPAAAPVKCR
jgi:hypothetical protein